jgi:hypothetical protein
MSGLPRPVVALDGANAGLQRNLDTLRDVDGDGILDLPHGC